MERALDWMSSTTHCIGMCFPRSQLSNGLVKSPHQPNRYTVKVPQLMQVCAVLPSKVLLTLTSSPEVHHCCTPMRIYSEACCGSTTACCDRPGQPKAI